MGCNMYPVFGGLEKCVHDHAPHSLVCYGVHFRKDVDNLLESIPIIGRLYGNYHCPYYEPLSKYQIKGDKTNE